MASRASSATNWARRVALVTGASAGIGATVCEHLVLRLGMKVIGCARNIDKIEESAVKLRQANTTGSLHAIKCDLRHEDEILAMFAEIKEKYGGVDVCVNNAGLAHPATLLEGKTEQWRNMFDVNVLALCICTREAYQSMKERNIDDGYIIHISSMSGYRLEQPATNVYAATKHSVKALTEGLRLELREIKSNIRITSISPGDVSTEFCLRMYPDDPSIHEKSEAAKKCLEPKDLADAVVHVLQTPPHVQVHDLLMRPTEQTT
ncbi:dehydrogenase/reductase SDR family member 11-like [Amphiura filiformis]|uniref:dehydrogenase/reductase SDR family member 11-like n=1 Tax=Amphiura filiformis TaxID=82378 RepID=UPI003B226BDF